MMKMKWIGNRKKRDNRAPPISHFVHIILIRVLVFLQKKYFVYNCKLYSCMDGILQC